MSHTNYWTKIKIFALRFGMAAALGDGGGGWAVMDRRTEEWLQFETGGDRGDLFWTDSSHFTLLTPSGGCCHTAARRGDGGALLPPSPQLMEIISPISAGRCQNGKIMSSSRATIHYLNCLVVDILKWNFQTKKGEKGKSEGLKKREKSW